MSDFDVELKRAFAALEDPADDGFVVAVASRVASRERRLEWAGIARLAAFGLAALAFAIALVSIAQSVGPGMVAQLGLDFANAYGAVAKSTPDPGTVQAALASALTPLLLAAAAGIGGLALARTAEP